MDFCYTILFVLVIFVKNNQINDAKKMDIYIAVHHCKSNGILYNTNNV